MTNNFIGTIKESVTRETDGGISRVTWTWTSAVGGVASGTTMHLKGEIVLVAFDPGPVTPSGNYDVALSNEAGVDLLAAVGANLSDSASTAECPKTVGNSFPYVVDEPCTLTISGAGDAKSGRIFLYLRS